MDLLMSMPYIRSAGLARVDVRGDIRKWTGISTKERYPAIRKSQPPNVKGPD
tara:strand:+ start:130131 stop:130286 length:156 start_codon:yes stop_codon:yes gene_type:complete